MVKWFQFSCVGEEHRAKNAFFADEKEFHGVDWMTLKMGRFQPYWNVDSWLRASEKRWDGVVEDVLNAACSLPIFSKRLKDALDGGGIAAADVQYLPVRVFHRDGREANGYFIANVLSRIEALDRENCIRLEEDPNEIAPATGKARVTGIWGPIAVHAARLEGHDFVRLLEFFPEMLVSARFAAVYGQGGFTGAKLTPIRSQ